MNRWASRGLLAIAACGGDARDGSVPGTREFLPTSGSAPEQAGRSPGSAGQAASPRAPELPAAPEVTSTRSPIPASPAERWAPVDRCEAGSTRCDGARLEVCVPADGIGTEWLISQLCECGCRTQLGLSFCREESSCPRLACALGALRCSDERLERCADGFTWELVERCSGAGACDPASGGCVSVDAGAPAL